MTSIRHNSYLDAARACILDVGWKRTTLTDVARRAGVSRMTIYRTWPDMQTLLADLMTREWAGVATAVPHTGSTPADIAEGMVAAIRALRGNPLFRRILDVDPELVLPYLLDRRGRSQELILEILAEQIGRGQETGAIRAGDPRVLARTVVLAAHGLTLSAHTMVDGSVTEDDLDTELATFLARGLAP
ncbi:MAG: TetR/AcrR family transcriptional regulator [Nocardioides sp.]